MTKKLSVKNHLKNHLLWIAVLVAVFISACSSENEVTTPVNPDTNPPALTNISTNSSLEQNIPGEIVFYFSEDVIDFTTSDIDFSGFNLDEGEFITNSKKMYYWEITPKESGELNINILAGSFEDLAGNLNTNIISTNFTVEEDSTPPVLTIPNDPPLMKDTLGSMVFSFSEDVTNFTKSDIELSGVDVEEGEFITNSLSEYELKVTPAKIGTLNLKVKDNSVQDLTGKPLAPFSTNLSVLPLGGKYSLEDVVSLGKIPSDRSKFYELTKDVLSYYTGTPAVVAKYVKTNGTGDGSSWAKAANNPKATINGISGQSGSKIYLVLVSSGDYPSDSIVMKNHIAVIGGWSPSTQWERAGATRFDGQGNNRVFDNNQNNLNRTALLYSATITNGKATDRGGDGGGMYNFNSSPRLVKVTFSGNQANGNGGGMYSSSLSSSPTLVKVTFSGNQADNLGGGMYNGSSSSPNMTDVTFLSNKANQGGGIYSSRGSFTLHNGVFLGNTANQGAGAYFVSSDEDSKLYNTTFSGNISETSGGGIHIKGDSPMFFNTTFSGNISKQNGGGAYITDFSQPWFFNTTFTENVATNKGSGIYLAYNDGNSTRVINSIVWGNKTNGGTKQLEIEWPSETVRYKKFVIHYSIVEGGTSGIQQFIKSSSHNTNNNPHLLPLADNGGAVFTHALGSQSSAINKGIYVVVATGGELFFSEDKTEWYNSGSTYFDNQGIMPFNYRDLTADELKEGFIATDARGCFWVDLPDIGAYEYGGTPPSTD